jgi:hypothetical protein
VTVPADLLDEARATKPDLSPSALLQAELRDLVDCDHSHLACSHCGAPLDQGDVVQPAVARFYVEVQELITDYLQEGRGLEGLARAVRELAEGHIALELPGVEGRRRPTCRKGGCPEPATEGSEWCEPHAAAQRRRAEVVRSQPRWPGER